MPKPRAYSRYLFRERYKRQFVLTKTKLVVGFCLSLLGSIFVGSYFEKYGPVIIHQTITALRAMMSDPPAESEKTVETAALPTPTPATQTTSTSGADSISTLENRVKSIQFSSEADKLQREQGRQPDAAVKK